MERGEHNIVLKSHFIQKPKMDNSWVGVIISIEGILLEFGKVAVYNIYVIFMNNLLFTYVLIVVIFVYITNYIIVS